MLFNGIDGYKNFIGNLLIGFAWIDHLQHIKFARTKELFKMEFYFTIKTVGGNRAKAVDRLSGDPHRPFSFYAKFIVSFLNSL